MTFIPPARATPAWYRDAKLGIFIHWGLYSVPAFADDPDGTFHGYMGDLTAMRDTSGKNPYAEWYLNSLRIPGSPTAEHHAETYGADFSYFDFQAEFDKNAAAVDFAEWAEIFAKVGAQYVVFVTRHLDGYPLWPTSVPNPRMPASYRSARDLVGDLSAAVRARGMKMGLYYSGGIDWTFTDRPVRVMTDLMQQQSLGSEHARHAEAQWRELIERYSPSILWNDMGWPAESDLDEFFADYYEAVPDGVVNDRWTSVKLPRWGVARRLYLSALAALLRWMAKQGKAIPLQSQKQPFDIRTYEYEVPAAPEGTWEVTRGLGNSFGYSANEPKDRLLSGDDLVHLLVDIVARGGRLLLNVGPDDEGRIPGEQMRSLEGLSAWLDGNGDAIFATTPWTTIEGKTADGDAVRFTRNGATVYAIILADVIGTVRIPGITMPATSRARYLDRVIDWRPFDGGIEVMLPNHESAAAHVVAFHTGAPHAG